MVWVCCCCCCCSLAGIAGSIPVSGMDVCLLWVLCVVKYRFLSRADHLSRGVLPSVVCLSVNAKLRKWGGPGPLGAVVPWTKKKACRLRSHSLYRHLLRNVIFSSFLHPYTLPSTFAQTHTMHKLQTIRCLEFVFHSFLGKKTYKVSETASVPVLRWSGLEEPTLQGQIEILSKTGKHVLPICA